MDCIIEESVHYSSKNETADYSVLFGNEEIRCHRAMLMANSEYLAHHIRVEESARWSTTASSLGVRSIRLSGVRVDTFEVMLAHMYGCKLDISTLDYERLTRLLESSHLFGLSRLTQTVGQCLEAYLNCGNILKLTELASLYNLRKFSEICEKFISSNCEELLMSSDFLNTLTEEQLIYILYDLGKELYINEIDVYKAVNRWIATHRHLTEGNDSCDLNRQLCRKWCLILIIFEIKTPITVPIIKSIQKSHCICIENKELEYLSPECRDLRSKCVRYELISEDEFDEHILSSGHNTIEQYDQHTLMHAKKRERKRRVVNTNFIDTQSTAISGGFNTELLLRITPQTLNSQQYYEKLTQFAHIRNKSDSDDNDNNHLTIDLGKVRLINSIIIHFFDNCIETVSGDYSFSYYVETSTHKDRNYYRVVDHSGYRCRSKQTIYFYAREVRFIRVVGLTTYVDLQPENREPYLYIRSLSCQLTSYRFDISRGFWKPDNRITSTECGCCLNAGLDEPNYEWQTDTSWMLSATPLTDHYSYHKIPRNILLFNKNYIMVQLPQPIFCNRLSFTVLNEGNYRYRICFARCDPETDFREPIRDEEIEASDSVDIMFDYTCMQFIKINGYQQNAQRFKCSQMICPVN